MFPTLHSIYSLIRWLVHFVCGTFLVATISLITSFLFIPQAEPQYSLLAPGNSWTYKSTEGSFKETIDETKFNHNKIEYFQTIREYSDETVEISYHRKDKYGIVYYLDDESFQETIEIPHKPRLKYTWTSSDNKWEYKITGVEVELKTPARTYKNCIAIEARSTRTGLGIYLNYYSKGIGYIGTKVDGQLVTYLTSWKIKEKTI